MAQVAVRVLPLPDSALAPQPAIVVPPLVKLTLPVGAMPVTEAVNVTLAAAGEGLSELARPDVLLALTTCAMGALCDVALTASPP